MKKRALYLIEDNELMREMLKEYVETAPDLRVCGAAASAEAALEALPDIEADLLLIDVALPGMSGIELLGVVKTRWPELPCLMLSAHQETSYVRRSLAAGAHGYVLKGAPEEILVGAHEVLGGGTYVSEPLRRKLNGNPFASSGTAP